jgi:hypothetical protein
MDEAHTFYKPSSGQWARVCKDACGWRIEILADDRPRGFLPTALCQDFKEAVLRLAAAGYVRFCTLYGLDGELVGVLEGDVIRLNTGEQWRVQEGLVFRTHGAKEECVGKICEREICRSDGNVLCTLDEPR